MGILQFEAQKGQLSNAGVKIDKVSRCKLCTLTILWTRAPPATAIPPASSLLTAAKTSTSSARPAGQGVKGGGGGGERSTGGGSLCNLQQAINFILSKSTYFVCFVWLMGTLKGGFCHIWCEKAEEELFHLYLLEQDPTHLFVQLQETQCLIIINSKKLRKSFRSKKCETKMAPVIFRCASIY